MGEITFDLVEISCTNYYKKKKKKKEKKKKRRVEWNTQNVSKIIIRMANR